MQRFLTLTVAIAAAVGGLSAATITPIGGPNGLTGAYISANGGSTGGWGLKNYDSYLFNGVATGSAPGSAYNSNFGSAGNPATPPNNTITDAANGITFDLLDDGCSGVSGGACTGGRTNNVWVASQTGAPSTITIPIGIFNVTDVWTMLNNEYGPSGAQDTTIVFEFGSSATTANGPVVTLDLVNSSNTTGNTGQIRTNTTSTNGSCFSCAGFAMGSTASTSTVASTTSADNVKVTTNRIFNQAYSTTLSMPSAGTPFFGSNLGVVLLNDQGFSFGNSFVGSYLVDVKITEKNGVANTSQTVLSAITVVSTPEPSSILLMLSGLVGFVAFMARRRSISASN